MFSLLRAVMVFSLIVVAGCASITAALFDAKQIIEVSIGEHGAGTYTITADKDGNQIYKRQMRCDQGPDGKLTGCHKL